LYVLSNRSTIFLNYSSGEDVDEIQSSEALQFDFDIISDATDNFSEANKLGEGGFGSVYKVIILIYCNMNLTNYINYVLIKANNKSDLSTIYIYISVMCFICIFSYAIFRVNFPVEKL
jgi:hypothetical protein